jgi:hypothetical protein
MFYSFTTNAREWQVKKNLYLGWLKRSSRNRHRWEISCKSQMNENTWKVESQSYQILKLHIYVKFFAKSGRIEQGNLYCLVDSMCYVLAMDVRPKKSRFWANVCQLVIMNKRMVCNMQRWKRFHNLCVSNKPWPLWPAQPIGPDLNNFEMTQMARACSGSSKKGSLFPFFFPHPLLPR